jgi:hypothetical protein
MPDIICKVDCWLRRDNGSGCDGLADRANPVMTSEDTPKRLEPAPSRGQRHGAAAIAL